jgi:hypothetical protein
MDIRDRRSTAARSPGSATPAPSARAPRRPDGGTAAPTKHGQSRRPERRRSRLPLSDTSGHDIRHRRRDRSQRAAATPRERVVAIRFLVVGERLAARVGTRDRVRFKHVLKRHEHSTEDVQCHLPRGDRVRASAGLLYGRAQLVAPVQLDCLVERSRSVFGAGSAYVAAG